MQTFPYTAYRITPSFYVEAVVLVSTTQYGAHVSDKGKWFAPMTELFDTKDSALLAAALRLASRKLDLETKLARIPKLLANLESSK